MSPRLPIYSGVQIPIQALPVRRAREEPLDRRRTLLLREHSRRTSTNGPRLRTRIGQARMMEITMGHEMKDTDMNSVCPVLSA